MGDSSIEGWLVTHGGAEADEEEAPPLISGKPPLPSPPTPLAHRAALTPKRTSRPGQMPRQFSSTMLAPLLQNSEHRLMISAIDLV
jgi:hypothetical protein